MFIYHARCKCAWPEYSAAKMMSWYPTKMCLSRCDDKLLRLCYIRAQGTAIASDLVVLNAQRSLQEETGGRSRYSCCTLTCPRSTSVLGATVGGRYAVVVMLSCMHPHFRHDTAAFYTFGHAATSHIQSGVVFLQGLRKVTVISAVALYFTDPVLLEQAACSAIIQLYHFIFPHRSYLNTEQSTRQRRGGRSVPIPRPQAQGTR